MSFTIAIIGRPNVGKSTLFNRLTGKRSAIVHNQPGVTRDLKEDKANIGPLEFTLFDTPGLEETNNSPEKALEERMMVQTERAVDLADMALMTIDGKEGATAMDAHFARWIRKKNIPVILVVNKCEGKASDAGFREAYSLGLGDPVAISAEHGEGLADLFDRISELYQSPPKETAEDEEAEEIVQIAIVGRPNVGKSTLSNQLLGMERSVTGPEAGITRDAIYNKWEYKGKQILLVDTAGVRKRPKIQEKLEKLSVDDTNRAIQYANIVILLLDATQALDKQDLFIADKVFREGRGLIIALNKWDLVKNPAEVREKISYKLEKSFSQGKGIPIITLSALEGKNINKLMDKSIEVFSLWNQRLSTGKLNRWLENTIERHPPPLAGGKRLKIRYITQNKARPPTFILFVNKSKEFPESYLRYLINSLREEFDFAGVPIRMLLRKGENPYN